MPEKCLEGQGCLPVIETAKIVTRLSAELTATLDQSSKAMKDHAEQSRAFWTEQKEHVRELSLQMRECLDDAQEAALKFNDGYHRMAALKEDVDALGRMHRDADVRHENVLRDHERSPIGLHTQESIWVNRELKLLGFGFGGLGIVVGTLYGIVAVLHRHEFIDALLFWR